MILLTLIKYKINITSFNNLTIAIIIQYIKINKIIIQLLYLFTYQFC